MTLDTSLIEKLAIECGEYIPDELETDEAYPTNHEDKATKIAGLKEADYNKIKNHVQKELTKHFKNNEPRNSREPHVRSRLRTITSRALLACDIPLGQSVMEDLVDELGADCLGLGPIDQFFYEPEVTEIIARKDEIRVEKNGKLRPVEGLKFRSEQHIRDILIRMLAHAGRSISEKYPYADATLFDGSRLEAQVPPMSPEGTMFSIRRFRDDMTLENLLKRGTLNKFTANFLKAAVRARLNIIISGGTGSGKTTTMNVLGNFIPHEESLVTIENPCELQLQHPFVRKLQARPPDMDGKNAISQKTCIARALRMRPDRILVGECREDETLAMLQAMNTGHPGSMSSIHSDSALDCADRLYTLISMYSNIPHMAIYNLMKTVKIIIQVIREEETGRRRIDHIVEVRGIKKDEVTGSVALDMNTLIQYDKEKDDFVWVAKDFKHRDVLVKRGGWQG